MRVVGFSFDKISIEKLKEKIEKLSIKTNIDISEIKKVESNPFKAKEELVQVKFTYIIKYEPGFANVEMKGTIILSLDENTTQEVVKEWKKKAMPEQFKTFLFNIIMRKASIRALSLEDELNLPLHLPLPTIKVQKEK